MTRIFLIIFFYLSTSMISHADSIFGTMGFVQGAIASGKSSKNQEAIEKLHEKIDKMENDIKEIKEKLKILVDK